MEHTINLIWDNEAAVWVATSDTIPGLALESGSYDALLERLRYAVPELLELNKVENPALILNFHSERHERIAL